MKKIFALVLAVLTVVGLSSAAFAAPLYSTPDLSGLLLGGYDGSSVYYGGGLYGLGGLLGFVDTDGKYKSYDEIYTSWYDTCPKDNCEGTAIFYVESGAVKWFCTKCSSTGTVTIPGGSSGSGSGSGSGTIHSTLVCTVCGKSDKLSFQTYGIIDGKYCEIYKCSRCDKLFPVEVKGSAAVDTDYYGFKKEMNCLSDGCKKTATREEGYVVKGDKLYVRYKCTAGHTNDIEVSDTYYSGGAFYHGYSIQVVSAAGGTYSLDSSTARYGDTRTVTFYPSTGYVLSSVKVNGVEAGVRDNKVSFVVTGDTVVRPTFVQAYTLKDYTITAKTNGNGSVSVSKNNYSQYSAASVTAKYTDKVVYTFTPASRAYRVSDVKIDGKSQGAVSSYTFNGVTSNHTVEVTFSWTNPYCDVETKYLGAVEYVTEAGLMGKYNTVSGKTYFSGRTGITVGDLVYALTELSDTAGRLNSDLDRVAWAINYGIISKNTNLDAACDVRQACTLIKLYLEVLEDLNKVTFTKLNRRGTVRDNAISLNLATGKTYDGNRSLHRYDLASICRLIARLEYKG